MHIASIIKITPHRGESASTSKYLATINVGEADLKVTVSTSSTDELLITGKNAADIDAEAEAGTPWSVSFKAMPDARPPGINPIPFAVRVGERDIDAEPLLTLAGKLATFGLFVAAGYLLSLIHI